MFSFSRHSSWNHKIVFGTPRRRPDPICGRDVIALMKVHSSIAPLSSPMPPKAKNMTAAQAIVVNLVNPKLQNFSKPLFLGVTIALFSVGILLGVFFFEKAKTRCTPISFPTPAREVQFHAKQVVGGFNFQRKQVDENFRFGGLPCNEDGTMFDAYAQGFGLPQDSVHISCGRGGSWGDNGMQDPAQPSGIAAATPMFFVDPAAESRV